MKKIIAGLFLCITINASENLIEKLSGVLSVDSQDSWEAVRRPSNPEPPLEGLDELHFSSSYDRRFVELFSLIEDTNLFQKEIRKEIKEIKDDVTYLYSLIEKIQLGLTDLSEKRRIDLFMPPSEYFADCDVESDLESEEVFRSEQQPLLNRYGIYQDLSQVGKSDSEDGEIEDRVLRRSRSSESFLK